MNQKPNKKPHMLSWVQGLQHPQVSVNITFKEKGIRDGTFWEMITEVITPGEKFISIIKDPN